ncbi:MAG: DNA alkylation repair protein [Deltaproteobacteria bacterium]|nr:DNA alkylation repair protein [Deltaproteobacteria bacterium]
MHRIVETARDFLREHADARVRESTRQFFKEDILVHGVKAAQVKRAAGQVWAAVRKRPKRDVFDLCDLFWESGYMEEGGIACELAYRARGLYTPDDLALFDRWLDVHVRNWAHCDMLCTRSVGAFIGMYPDSAARVRAWADSGNRWKKRAAAVSFIPLAKEDAFRREIYAVADTLLGDQDDMVRKGYGWALKVAGGADPETVFAFLMERRSVMPRTAFWYALEKLPPAMRVEAMKK